MPRNPIAIRLVPGLLSVLYFAIIATVVERVAKSNQAEAQLFGLPPPPVVTLPYATYQGTYNITGNSTYFLGIRYAAPPTGALRLQAPQPPPTALGVQFAISEPVSCYQEMQTLTASQDLKREDLHAMVKRELDIYKANGSTEGIKNLKRQLIPPFPQSIQNEDCLFLNVWTPGQFNPNTKYPVIVWIYGGGYNWGSMSLYNGNDLITDSVHGAVAVIMQYRTGAFGFLSGSEVKEKGALNIGLLDQQMAFEWVQQYIHLFGGDPTQVTIWGESSGAGSVMNHIVANGGNTQPPLFRAAITTSTYVPPQLEGDSQVPTDIFNTLANDTGCGFASDKFQCLQELEPDIFTLTALAISTGGFFGAFVFVPVVDGTFIQESPLTTLARGAVNGEILYSTTNTNEGLFFTVPFSTDTTLSLYVSNLIPNLADDDVQTLVDLYTNLGLDDISDTESLLVGEGLFKCPTYALLQAFNGNAFKGMFAIPPAFHGEELEYYFDGLRLFNNVQFEASFSQSFLNFAKGLDPYDANHPDPNNITPVWAKWSTDNPVEMVFNETADGRSPAIGPITSDPDMLARCQIWNSLGLTITE